jgi:hypothetical protein
MRRMMIVLVGVSVLASSSGWARASQMSRQERSILKAQQKQERKSEKLKNHYAKASFKGQHVPKAVRDQRKHEIQKEDREMRERQKDQMQELKDRQKLYKESLKNLDQN